MPPKKGSKGPTRIAPISAKRLIKVFEECGFEVDAQTGSHLIMRKRGHPFNLSIPIHSKDEVHPPVIRSLIRRAGITRSKYLNLLKKI